MPGTAQNFLATGPTPPARTPAAGPLSDKKGSGARGQGSGEKHGASSSTHQVFRRRYEGPPPDPRPPIPDPFPLSTHPGIGKLHIDANVPDPDDAGVLVGWDCTGCGCTFPTHQPGQPIGPPYRCSKCSGMSFTKNMHNPLALAQHGGPVLDGAAAFVPPPLPARVDGRSLKPGREKARAKEASGVRHQLSGIRKKRARRPPPPSSRCPGVLASRRPLSRVSNAALLCLIDLARKRDAVGREMAAILDAENRHQASGIRHQEGDHD